MENPVMSDIFKFMALRSPQNFDHEKDVVRFIRDYRIRDTYLPAETYDIGKDDGHFTRSKVGQFVFEQIKLNLQNVKSNLDVLTGNRLIADSVKTQYSIDERTAVYIDEFVDVIRSHMTNFNKFRLLEELDAVVKKHFHDYTGITDYVEKLAKTKRDNVEEEFKASQFCIDFDRLFDQLYTLYVCKRKYPINLEHVMDGLRALHIIRFLNIELNNHLHEIEERKGCLLALLALFQHRNNTSSKASDLSTIHTTESNKESRTNCAVMKLTNNGHFPVPRVTIMNKEDLARIFGASPAIHKIFAYLHGYYKPFNDIRPIGIGDLLVVKQFLNKYVTGEIAHVENVLKGESKERSHRRLDRAEDIYTTESEKNEDTQKELQTTSRYELQAETASTIQNDLNAQLSASVSGKYGTVQFSTSTGISYHLSKNDSQRSASNFSKDIVDRSLNRIQTRVRDERTTKKISEIEEINKHGFNNVNGSGNISGIYRWLDKHYKAQVYNYGKRLMFEFIIPEPASFLKAVVELKNKKKEKPDNLSEPPKPGTANNLGPATNPSLLVNMISKDDVNYWAQVYGIPDLDPEPSRGWPINVSCTMNDSENSTREYSLEVPPGYYVASAEADGKRERHTNADTSLTCTIGGQTKRLDDEMPKSDTDPTPLVTGQFHKDYDPALITPIQNKLVITVAPQELEWYAFNVIGQIAITEQKLSEWQLQTYGKIMTAYNKKIAEYKGNLADYQEKLDNYNASQSVKALGHNPKINEDIIKTELKKHCITMISKQFAADKINDIDFNTIKSRKEQEQTGQDKDGNPILSPIDIPAIDIDNAREKGIIIQFLEQAFEWPQINYLLYPYFWGKLPDWWLDAQEYYDELDPLYAKFLQAGSARVLVAVHPAYEAAVMHYLYTQEPWNGGEAPTINDSMYIPIYAELRNQQDDLYGAEPYGDPWNVIIPTSLIYLQDNSELPSFETTKP